MGGSLTNLLPPERLFWYYGNQRRKPCRVFIPPGGILAGGFVPPPARKGQILYPGAVRRRKGTPMKLGRLRLSVSSLQAEIRLLPRALKKFNRDHAFLLSSGIAFALLDQETDGEGRQAAP